MSKIKEMHEVIKELRTTAKSIDAIADSLVEMFSTKEDDTEKTTQTFTLSEVRAVLSDKSRHGFTAEVKKLLQKYGAEKLSDVNPADYPDLLKDAEVLDNG